ncbi:hypothetical protein [Yoonia vestfoldensis]|uniref:hypothetical protein n=1 Tax=Yoonia vestfoldensis TaxID=245188 RepID=UPI0013A558C2|nr:hypothetical protein [Yoonia vestfoldensis]
MRETPIALTLGGLSVLVACASVEVQAAQDGQFTHSARVQLGALGVFGNWEDASAGRDIALGAAKETCGLPDATADTLALTRGISLYDIRDYSFACPQPGKVIQ